jgi:hypothetical protein
VRREKFNVMREEEKSERGQTYFEGEHLDCGVRLTFC